MQLATVNQQELAQKAAAWGKFGEAVYTTEIAISNKALAAVNGVTLPNTIEDIAAAEALLKTLKATKTEVQNERKAITSKTDALNQRLMEPEKSLDEPIKTLEAAIIKIKKAHEAEAAKERAKAEERKRIIEVIKNAANAANTAFKNLVLDKVDKAYTYALGEYNLQPADKDEYLRKCRVKVSVNSFVPPAYQVPKMYHTDAEVEALKAEHYQVDRESYVVLFAEELEKRFSDYAVAYNNKAQALRIAAEEKARQEAEILEQQQQAQMAVKIESAAVTETPDLFTTKALKKAYEVDMPETSENAIRILAAFTANLQLCLPKVRVTKWFSFTPAQAANALAKVKCDDNNFQPSGIIFKEVDKL